jgi:transglutaminase-like putative cysteine protease
MYFDEYYPKYRQICRQFSLLKYIKMNFKYVSDPSDFDYFASPQESINLMAGDCDDYSILMASVLKSIGANVRIIWAPKHVYPELYCGDKVNFEKYVSAIYTLFEQEIGKKQIYYRMDKNENYWINIDYTDFYPGSVYHSNEVLSIIYIK